MKTIREDLDRARVNVAALNNKSETRSSQSASSILASTEMSDWWKQKIDAAFDSPAFRSKVKEMITGKLDDLKISVVNISKTTQEAISRWAVNAVSTELSNILSSNADVAVQALKKEFLALKSSDSTEKIGEDDQQPSQSGRKILDAILKKLQDQITVNKDEVDKLKSTAFKGDIEMAMSVAAIRAVFSDMGTAATKVMEILKLWSHFQPERDEEVKMAAQNLLNFQQGKGNPIPNFVKIY